MNVENMRKLIAHLEAVGEAHFDMTVYATHDTGSRTEYRKVDPEHVKEGGCGTAACIAGHAAALAWTDPAFESVATALELPRLDQKYNEAAEDWAREWLGLDGVVAEGLFLADWWALSSFDPELSEQDVDDGWGPDEPSADAPYANLSNALGVLRAMVEEYVEEHGG